MQGGTTIDLKPTVGKALEVVVRAALPEQFSVFDGTLQGSLKQASCDRLEFDTRSQLLSGDFTISYAGKILKVIPWSLTTKLHVMVDVRNPLNSRYVIDVGKYPGLIDSDKIRGYFLGLYNRAIDAIKGWAGERLNTQTLGETAFGSPSMVEFKGKQFLFWSGTDTAHRLNMMPYQGGAWGKKVTLSESSRSGVAVAVYKDKLYVAWSGMSDYRLRVMAFDGTKWSATTVLGETTGSRPALAVHNNQLVLAWTGTNVQSNINLLVSSDGQRWTGKRTLKESAVDGPALASHNGRLFLAWTGTNLGRNLNVMSSADLGATWQNKRVLGESSGVGPALQSDGAQLYLGWAGTDLHHQLNVLKSSDGLAFGGKETWAEGSDSTPCLTFFGAKLHMVWTNREQHIAVGEKASPILGSSLQSIKQARPAFLDQVFTTL
ncbi:MAG: hypothetical protein U0797_23325 [Gemmataceae bacterium]